MFYAKRILLVVGGGWAREMRQMDEAEKVMQDLMNDRNVSPNNRTFDALLKGYSCLFHEDRNWRAERMYYWLCRMRDMKIKPNQHTKKPFTLQKLHFLAMTNRFGKTTECHTTLEETALLDEETVAIDKNFAQNNSPKNNNAFA